MFVCEYTFLVMRVVEETTVVKRATIPVSLPLSLVEKIERLRAKLGYRSRNDVIRESIDRFVEEMEETKVIYMRDATLEEAKKEIVKYLKRRGTVYISEMAEDLGIDIPLIFKAAEELEKGGVVGE